MDEELELAAARGDVDTVRRLIEEGAKTASTKSQNSGISNYFLGLLKITSSLEKDDDTSALHKASANGHEAVVEVLLKAGADHSISNRVSMIQCILNFQLSI